VTGDPYTGELPISAPAWSPDGRLIAYSDSGVCVIRPDGGGRHCFSGICFIRPDGSGRHCFKTGPSWESSWSPDSTRLAFLQGALQGDQSRLPYLRIEVIDRDGRNLRVLRTCCEVDPWYGPVWSRRNLIAFGSDGANCLLSPANGSLFALNLGAVVDDLGWSPDGKQIAYSSQADSSLHLLRVRPKHLTPAMALATIVNGAPRCGTPAASTTG
jgi:Tol biopolymer transport system component